MCYCVDVWCVINPTNRPQINSAFSRWSTLIRGRVLSNEKKTENKLKNLCCIDVFKEKPLFAGNRSIYRCLYIVFQHLVRLYSLITVKSKALTASKILLTLTLLTLYVFCIKDTSLLQAPYFTCAMHLYWNLISFQPWIIDTEQCVVTMTQVSSIETTGCMGIDKWNAFTLWRWSVNNSINNQHGVDNRVHHTAHALAGCIDQHDKSHSLSFRQADRYHKCQQNNYNYNLTCLMGIERFNLQQTFIC